MSIYPVRLKEWFPPGDDWGMYDICAMICNTSKCLACNKRIRFIGAVGHHSLPWGNGDIWCSWKCCDSGKVYKLDKREQRKLNRLINKTWDKYINVSSGTL